MIMKSKNGWPVQVSIETWPPLFAAGVKYHAIVKISNDTGHEYRRHETARFDDQADAVAAAHKLLEKRGYTP